MAGTVREEPGANPIKVRTERLDLTPRTSDPTNTREGDWWVRSDVAPDTDQIGTFRGDVGGGETRDVPIFDTAAEFGTDIETHWRVAVNGTQGVIPTTDDGAAIEQLGIWDSGVRYGAHDDVVLSAVPDSVVSRPDDDNTFITKLKYGHGVSLKSNWKSIGAAISQKTAGATRAYLHEEDNDGNLGNLITSVSVSGLSAGDAFTFNSVNLKNGNNYFIVLDAEGSTWTCGFLNTITENYPYTSQDIDIINRWDGNDDVAKEESPVAINDVGNTGFS